MPILRQTTMTEMSNFSPSMRITNKSPKVKINCYDDVFKVKNAKINLA